MENVSLLYWYDLLAPTGANCDFHNSRSKSLQHDQRNSRDKQTNKRFNQTSKLPNTLQIYISTNVTTQSTPTSFGNSGQLGIFLMRWGVYPYMIFVILLTPAPFSAQNCDTKNHAKSGFLIPKNIKNALILDILTPG